MKYLWTKIRLSWEMFKNQPDLLFVPSHTLPIFFPKKTVITVHDLGYERYPQAYSFFYRYYLRKNYRFAVNRATKIIVPSHFTKKELINLYRADPKKIEVVHLGYNDKIFRPIERQEKIEKVLEKYKIKKPYLLFVGRLEIKKGLKTLFEALQFLVGNHRFSNLNLVLIGMPGFGYQELKFKIQNSKFKIHQIGYLKGEEERACFYNGAEIFVFPSLYEGFGLPILEAMACGCPVIASDIEPLKEVGDQSILFFQVGNVEGLAQNIKEVLENQDLKNQIIQKGFERVKNFSWQKCAQETIKILESL
ncbi:MAG: glycosyltransferase family 4 protein [Patescibacteria group bacterium]|nr:glycosyltransferase family 4 protein [Patescibacteria group bacterium]